MLLRHSGQFLVGAVTSGSVLCPAMGALTGSMIRKKTAAAIKTNEITSLRNCPYLIRDPETVATSELKSGASPGIAMLE
jgi:hypothetical protein